MKKKLSAFTAGILSLGLILSACTGSSDPNGGTDQPTDGPTETNAPGGTDPDPEDEVIQVVATTTMLADLAREIGGDRVDVTGLMGPGIDPHLYQPSAGDVNVMQGADIVVYNGLDLEGRMSDIFANLDNMTDGPYVVSVEDHIDHSKLLDWEDDNGIYDPHVWFDVTLWSDVAVIVADGFSEADPENESLYQANLESYQIELDEADTYIRERAEELEPQQRVLVTAHDAFQYFGHAYGFEVHGLQGLSTESEAGTADISEMADLIVDLEVKAIFIESSVPTRTIEALQDAVVSRGFDVEIGGELYSDSLGDEEAGTESYIETVKANIDTIVDALK